NGARVRVARERPLRVVPDRGAHPRRARGARLRRHRHPAQGILRRHRAQDAADDALSMGFALRALVLLRAASLGAQAAVLYKHVSPGGVIEFSDTPPDKNRVVDKIPLNEDGNPTTWAQPR